MIASVAIIGRGKAGGSLRASLEEADISPLASFSHQAISQLKLDAFDCVFICVPDSCVRQVAAQIAKLEKRPSCVVHVSGAQDLSALAPLQGLCVRAQFHPLCVLDGHSPIKAQSVVAYCSDDMDYASAFEKLALRMKLVPIAITNGQQLLYHAAAVIMSNHSFVLAHDAIKLLKKAGFSDEKARYALARLMHSFADTLEKLPLPEAITGPVKRGDHLVIAQHISAIAREDDCKDIKQRYEILMKDLEIIIAK